MRSLYLAAIAALILSPTIAACDDNDQAAPAECPAVPLSLAAPAECPAVPLSLAAPADAPDVAFREKPYAAYIDTIKGHPIDTIDFCETLQACDAIEPKTWRLTETGYKVNPGSSDDRSMGIGGASIAGEKYWTCVTDFFDANGAVEF